MTLYHCTSASVAATVLREGFRNSGPVPSLGIHAGVWFADAPIRTTHALDGGGRILAVKVPEKLAAEFVVAGSPGEAIGRFRGEGSGWREFCIPAALANELPIEDAGALALARESA